MITTKQNIEYIKKQIKQLEEHLEFSQKEKEPKQNLPKRTKRNPHKLSVPNKKI